MAFNEELVQQVWEKERAVLERDPRTWRKDECGAWIRREHYGRKDSEFGWVIDYITPGGPADPANLRAIQWQNNSGLAGQRVCHVTADPKTFKNREERRP